MRIRFQTFLLLVCWSQSSLASEVRDVFEVLEGEYNNNEQVWQRALDGDRSLTKQHWAWSVTSERSLGLSVTQGQSPDAPELTFEFGLTHEGIRSEVRFADGTSTQCVYAWSKTADGFEGRLEQDASCAEPLPALWQIGREFLTITPASAGGEGDSTPFRARRVSYYKGWIALSRQSIDERAADDDYLFLADLRAHDEGFITPILDQGQPTGYAVELARLTYQNTGVAVLKLGIIEEATGETLAYSWANPGAALIGINLRWVQCGFTSLSQQH